MNEHCGDRAGIVVVPIVVEPVVVLVPPVAVPVEVTHVQVAVGIAVIHLYCRPFHHPWTRPRFRIESYSGSVIP